MGTGSVAGRTYHFIRIHLVAGTLVAIPLGITFIVVRWLFLTIDSFLQPVIISIFHRYFPLWFPSAETLPGVGIVGVVFVVFLLGLLTTNVIGRKLLSMQGSLLGKTPIVSNIYLAAKQVVDAIRISGQSPFKRVVIVQYPSIGLKCVGFATGPVLAVDGQRMMPIFIPTAPNPTSGFVILFPEDQVVFTNMSPDAAFRMVVSGGMVSPDSIGSNGENRLDKDSTSP